VVTISSLNVCQQTHAEFERKGGEMSLVSLERLCDVKHARCDTECSPTSRSCWSCCQDNNNCNTFPVHVNLVYTSAARSVVPEVTTLVSVLAIAWSTVSRFSQDTLIWCKHSSLINQDYYIHSWEYESLTIITILIHYFECLKCFKTNIPDHPCGVCYLLSLSDVVPLWII